VTWVAVSIAGGLGAACRYLLDHAITARASTVFPWGTIVVNVSGSLAAGVVLGLTTAGWLPAELRPPVAGGFLGAYTTFSTAMYQSARLLEDGESLLGLVSLVVPLVLATVAALVGYLLVV
jgi:fluoride exporter